MEKLHNPFRGLGVAMITPFTTDGSVDEPALRALTESLVSGGVDFLCVLGTTAETPTLSDAERASVCTIVSEVNAGRVPLLLGMGGNCTDAVCRSLRESDLSGFAGVLIVTPFYNKPTQEGLYQHFCAVSEASPLPVVLYNVPGRTGVNLEAETTLRIARDCANVVAVKEASGKIEQIEKIISEAPKGFEVLSGDDAITCRLIESGAAGVISVVANAYPREFGAMVHKAMVGHKAEAEALDAHFAPLYPLLTADGNPAGIKALLALMGKCENVLRLPLVPAREETMERLREELASIGD